MPTPFESAQLNLQLFDMRREPVLRKARDWFIMEFHPKAVDEYFAVMATDKNSWVRMVVGYWDMAASMVVQGAIDHAAFMAAHGEIVGMFAKVQPFLADIRARTGPHVLMNVETVVMAIPDAAGELERRRTRLRTAWEATQGTKAGFIV